MNSPHKPQPHWYHKKAYAHFDLPLSEQDAAAYVSDSRRIASHQFFPFLAFDIVQRRYRRKGNRGFSKKKSRPIRVAAHRDGYVFAYYADILAQAYEKHVSRGVSNCVLAYRKGLGSNIDFASDAFDEVERRGTCAAIALDLEGFFDNIDHGFLKKAWCDVLGVHRLPKDHFAVYRAMTRYATMDRDSVFSALGIKNATEAPRPLCGRDRRERGRRFRELRDSGLLNVNNESHGIPQGSPMSAVLSNVYMMHFDERMASYAASVGGYYRRYSDDILLIVDPDDIDSVVNQTKFALSEVGATLELNDDKTVISVFNRGKLATGYPPLQYLGFVFDGDARFIRSQTLSRFWRKAVTSIRAAKNRAAKAASQGEDGRLRKRKIYRRYTHLGKRNFLTYAKRADKKLGAGSIRRQMRSHWTRIHKEISGSP